jgi:hypothetical protein
MERELIISPDFAGKHRNKINREIENIKKIFPDVESFATFKTCYEVFNFKKRKQVKENFRLKQIFKKGYTKGSAYIPLCLN